MGSIEERKRQKKEVANLKIKKMKITEDEQQRK